LQRHLAPPAGRRRQVLVPLMQDWNNFSVVVDDLIVAGDRVVSLGAYAGVNKATGKAMRTPFAHVWQVADCKLARFEHVYGDAAAPPNRGASNGAHSLALSCPLEEPSTASGAEIDKQERDLLRGSTGL
jgi:hypothetical protein